VGGASRKKARKKEREKKGKTGYHHEVGVEKGRSGRDQNDRPKGGGREKENGKRGGKKSWAKKGS